MWWFITAYIILFLLIPGINSIINRLSFKSLVIVCLIFWAAYYCTGFISFPYAEIKRAVFFYLIGVIMRKKEFTLNKRVSLLLFAFVWLAGFALEGISVYTEINAVQNTKSLILDLFFKACIQAFVVPLSAIFLFEFFCQLDIKYSRIINTVSSTTFGIYLIHDSAAGRDFIWSGIFDCLGSQYVSDWYPLLMVVSCIIVFCVCSVIDLLRQKFVEKPFMSFLNSRLLMMKESKDL